MTGKQQLEAIVCLAVIAAVTLILCTALITRRNR